MSNDFDVYFGDARCCPVHPHVKISSDDGMFDGPCPVCEYEMDMHSEHGDEQPPLVVKPPVVEPDDDDGLPF